MPAAAEALLQRLHDDVEMGAGTATVAELCRRQIYKRRPFAALAPQPLLMLLCKTQTEMQNDVSRKFDGLYPRCSIADDAWLIK